MYVAKQSYNHTCPSKRAPAEREKKKQQKESRPPRLLTPSTPTTRVRAESNTQSTRNVLFTEDSLQSDCGMGYMDNRLSSYIRSPMSIASDSQNYK